MTVYSPRQLCRCLAAAALLTALLGPAGKAAGEGRIAYLAATDGLWQVWLTDAEGAAPRQLTRSKSDKVRVSWYPDGRFLLANTLGGEQIRLDAGTGQEIPLELPARGSQDAVVSPDGRQIAYSISPAGERDVNDIFVAGLEDGEQRILTRSRDLQHEPRWAPSGDWIYFLAKDAIDQHSIWRVRSDGGAKERLTAGRGFFFDVAVAGEGRIAYSGNQSGDYEIYTLEPGRSPVRWTESPGLDGGPAWGPDGRALVFHSSRSGTLNLWLQEGPEGVPRQLTDHDGGARSPAWWAAPRQGEP